MGSLFSGRCYAAPADAAGAYCGNAFPQFGRVNGTGLQAVTSCSSAAADSVLLREAFLSSDGRFVTTADASVPVVFPSCSDDSPLGPVGLQSLSAADGALLGAVILGVWASAFAVRAAIRALNVADRDDADT